MAIRQSIWADARQGKKQATEQVICKLRSRLTKLAAYYAGRTGEPADDLLQEAWLGIFRALPEMDETIGSPEQYLLQRARWRILDAVQRAQGCRTLVLDDAAAEMLPDQSAELRPETTFPREFSRQLKANQREVLNCLLEGKTWRETGTALGCTSANVAYHVRQLQRQYRIWEGEAV